MLLVSECRTPYDPDRVHVQNGFQGGLKISGVDDEPWVFVRVSPVDEDSPGSGQRGPYPRPVQLFEKHARNLGHVCFNSFARVLFQALEQE